ncbi:MAG: Uma2 family endonuclease [Clostridia bacterium]|nr:Uma2 family endonuclease [Clostridia bacterium]MCI9413021.1 Uma2 family endonuclease [Clostridia bacterium]
MEENTANKLEKEEKKYTYADLLEMDDDKRYEIIDGKLYLMSSPRIKHQVLAGEIFVQLSLCLKGKKCKAFIAPLDVTLSNYKQDNKIYNVVQPDVLVVCNREQLKDPRKITDAPSFIIEILSPSTSRKDRLEKMNLYQKYGVKEYWIIDPVDMIVTPYILDENGFYKTEKNYDLTTEEIPVNILQDCKIDLREFLKENSEWINSTADVE